MTILRQRDSEPGYAPVDLGDVPDVAELLGRIGVGEFDAASVTAPVGRNNAWAGRTVDGHGVFVKQLIGTVSDVRQRMSRLLSFEEFVRASPGAGLRVPRLLGSDDAAGLVAFELVEEARGGAELMADEEFGLDSAAEIGCMLGRLHAAAIPADANIDRSRPLLPSMDLMRGISLEMFESSSAATLETWRIVHGDADLIAGVRRLCSWESDAPGVPSHCDFRVDQLLFSSAGPAITDWEEFRIADGARDVGAFAGEWVFRSILDIVTTRGDNEFADLDLTHELVVQRGTEKLARLRPIIEAFWAAYLRTRPDIDDRFTVRATAFAGWHLLDRLFAGAESSPRLSGIVKAAAGIGRGVLLAPEKFADAVGFADAGHTDEECAHGGAE